MKYDKKSIKNDLGKVLMKSNECTKAILKVEGIYITEMRKQLVDLEEKHLKLENNKSVFK